jgi:predicted transcriptional regulator
MAKEAIIVEESFVTRAKEVRSKQQTIQMQLGNLYMASQDIEKQQEQLVAEMEGTSEDIQALMAEIREQYGDGNLNIETGEFTPVAE